jgi:hypothetical protein
MLHSTCAVHSAYLYPDCLKIVYHHAKRSNTLKGTTPSIWGGARGIAFAVVTLVSGRPGSTTSWAVHGADTLKVVDIRLAILVPNPQVPEQLGVVDAALALPPCAAEVRVAGYGSGDPVRRIFSGPDNGTGGRCGGLLLGRGTRHAERCYGKGSLGAWCMSNEGGRILAGGGLR